jgi:hypothetical protein
MWQINSSTNRKCHGCCGTKAYLFEESRHVLDHPFTSLLNNFNGKTITRKMGLQGVLTKQKDGTLIIQILNMQKASLSIILQYVKLKVIKITQNN